MLDENGFLMIRGEIETFQDSFSDEFVFDERIMRHLAAAASRARLRGRERNRSSGLGASQVFICTSPTSGEDQAHETPSEECYNFTHESSVGNSPSSGTPPAVNAQPSSPPAVPSSAINGAVVFKPRSACTHTRLSYVIGSGYLSAWLLLAKTKEMGKNKKKKKKTVFQLSFIRKSDYPP